MSNRAHNNGSRRRDDDVVDSLFEVPAAVLCAMCGQADCPGCNVATDTESGVVAIVPWERSGGLWTRLWATANATTQGAEAFFAVLPDGEVPPAMRFAVLAELLAVLSMAMLLLPLAALVLPNLALEVVQSPSLRGSALRWFLVGIPGLALWMVAAHITHGAALDAGARRQGARSQRRRAVRFGLYACGWDLMSGPLGALMMLATRGLHDALELAELAMRVPGRASQAMLSGIYQLPPDRVARARRTGTLAAALLAVVSGAVVLGRDRDVASRSKSPSARTKRTMGNPRQAVPSPARWRDPAWGGLIPKPRIAPRGRVPAEAEAYRISAGCPAPAPGSRRRACRRGGRRGGARARDRPAG